VKKVKERSKICENSHASLDYELSGFSPALVIRVFRCGGNAVRRIKEWR